MTETAKPAAPSVAQQMLDAGNILFSRYAPPGLEAPGLPLPGTPMASGFDLCTRIDFTLSPGSRRLVPAGLRIALPRGLEAQVRPRSGLALKHGLTVLNAPGTIDADYRGEIGAILINHGQDTVSIKRGARIAQLVIARVLLPIDLLMPPHFGETLAVLFGGADPHGAPRLPKICEATPEDFDALVPTLRGARGFGSTGTGASTYSDFTPSK